MIGENIIILKAGEQPVPNDATIIFFIRIAFCRETKYVRLLRNLELFPQFTEAGILQQFGHKAGRNSPAFAGNDSRIIPHGVA